MIIKEIEGILGRGVEVIKESLAVLYGLYASFSEKRHINA
jgi:hypothetical protein